MARREESDVAGALVIVAGGFAALLFSVPTVGLLREQLRINCNTYPPGSEGEGAWTCADGISYIIPGVILLAMTGLSLIVGLVVALIARRELVARGWFTVLAVLPVVWTLAWTRYGSDELVSFPPGVPHIDFWMIWVGPAALTATVALAIAVVALAFRRRVAFWLTASAAAGVGIATVVQPGLGLGTLPSAALLCAALLRVKRPVRAGFAGDPGFSGADRPRRSGERDIS